MNAKKVVATVAVCILAACGLVALGAYLGYTYGAGELMDAIKHYESALAIRDEQLGELRSTISRSRETGERICAGFGPIVERARKEADRAKLLEILISGIRKQIAALRAIFEGGG